MKYKSVQRKKHRVLIGLIVFLSAILLAELIFLFSISGRNAGRLHGDEKKPTEAIADKNIDSIAIPGYEVLELKADSKKQDLCLPNPVQNICYFQIFLYLEDGTLLWQSELIEPGAISKPIILTQELSTGTYTNAVLKYVCFKMDGVTPLNGAQTKLTLWVK